MLTRRRSDVLPWALCAVLAACGGGDDGGAEPAGGGTSSSWRMPTGEPTEGEALRDIDWSAYFAPGDTWKQYEQKLVFNNDAEPETLDPAIMTGVPEHTLALFIHEGLTFYHPTTLQPLPGVAEWWDISEDRRTYTFHLRKSAKWSNGDPITAEDFRWSWQRALDPATGSHYAEMLYPVDNAVEFNTGKVTDFAQVGVKVADPHTLVVTLHSPTPYFLENVAFETLMPVHRKTVETHGDQWTKAENFVGSGAFTVQEWKPRSGITMVKNPHYWNAGIVRLETVVAKPLDDLNTAYQEYKAGQIDWQKTLPLPRLDEIRQEPDYYVWPYLGTYFYRFNTTKKPFGDVRVRQAFNLAVNKAEISRDVMKSGERPATTYVPYLLHDYGYPQVEGPAYDPEKAKQLLADAGYPGGKGFPEIELLYNTQERHKKVAEVLQSMLQSTLGVNVKLRNTEWQIYLKDTRALNYTMSRAGWIGDYNDPNTMLDIFVTGRGNNNTGWSNAAYDRLLAAVAREGDAEKRIAMLAEAEGILMQGVPILPLFEYVNQGLLRPRVKGLMENIRDLHAPQFIYLDGPPAKQQ